MEPEFGLACFADAKINMIRILDMTGGAGPRREHPVADFRVKSYLKIIRFAISNRLCVDLEYQTGRTFLPWSRPAGDRAGDPPAALFC